MPRHYRKPSQKQTGVKTYDKQMNDMNKPKKVKESDIFVSQKDKEKGKKKIKKSKKK
tara:strand:+ start:884 stop:1054 length:171 start_codon:yes stop_codon:yes gene_type:complete